MPFVRRYLRECDRIVALRANERRYKSVRYTCTVCNSEMLLGNKAKHCKTKKHELNDNLQKALCRCELLLGNVPQIISLPNSMGEKSGRIEDREMKVQNESQITSC